MAVPDGWPPRKRCTEPGLQASFAAARASEDVARPAVPESQAMCAAGRAGRLLRGARRRC